MLKIKEMILLLCLLFTFTVEAGHETGNGADTHLTRYLSAKQFAEVITKNLTTKKANEIFKDRDLFNIVSDNLRSWPLVISSIEFISTDNMLFEDGREKAAINLANSNQVKISKAYFEKYNLSLEEVIVIIIHESGHKLGVTDHQKLDRIGSTLVANIYKSMVQKDSWIQYLSLDSKIKNQFDSRLQQVALGYLANGDGIELAKFLFFFTKYDLGNCNLAQMFRYIGKDNLKVDVKYQGTGLVYGPIRVKYVNRFIKELTLFSRSLPNPQAYALVKYGMAKLKMYRVLYNENSTDFNILADKLTSILLDRAVGMDVTVENFKELVKSHFFIIVD